MTILYKADAHGKVLSIMITNESADKIESVSPCHELRRTNNLVRYDDCGSYWVLFIPFNGRFHDVERYNIREEHMRKFYFHNCYNTRDRKVILC